MLELLEAEVKNVRSEKLASCSMISATGDIIFIEKWVDELLFALPYDMLIRHCTSIKIQE